MKIEIVSDKRQPKIIVIIIFLVIGGYLFYENGPALVSPPEKNILTSPKQETSSSKILSALELSCAKGVARHCRELGEIYLRGQKDQSGQNEMLILGKRYLQKACELKEYKACEMLMQFKK